MISEDVSPEEASWLRGETPQTEPSSKKLAICKIFKTINQSYPTTTVIFSCLSLLISNVSTQQSQHFEVTLYLGKNEAPASRPTLGARRINEL